MIDGSVFGVQMDGKALSSLMGIEEGARDSKKNTQGSSNNSNNSSSSSSPFVSLKKSQGWVQMQRDCVRLPCGKDMLASKLKDLIKVRGYESIFDFEDHMEDITRDWLPKRLLSQ